MTLQGAISADMLTATMDGSNILVVDDDADIRDLILGQLRQENYRLLGAANAGELRQTLRSEAVDLIVLDLNLPDGDGLSLCRELRAEGSEVQIIMVTARGSAIDRVLGLELGADDYLVKPFAFSELLARVRSLLRRGSSTPQETALQLADLRLDLIRRRVERDGQRIDLTAKEFSLLELLLRRQGEVLPKSLIASQVWDMNFDSDTNIIEVAIRRLRLKVDDNFPNKLIHTVRGMGYVLEERGN